LIKAAIFVAALLPGPALAGFSPADFQGKWSVTSIAGSASVTGLDNPKAILGTTLTWTDTTVTDVDEVCDIHRGAMKMIPNRMLEWAWGGQTIAGLSLPAPQIRTTFGKVETLVFAGGERGCAENAIMMDHDHMLYAFNNGYIYVLTRRH
jgi:hypothetical protein